MKPYYDTMPKFESWPELLAYLESRGESAEQHEHLPVQDTWDDDKWVCEVPACEWTS